ncbi:hypothetical protein BH23GEM9_BH23GEM9_30470 [soil metagenome]
MIANQGRHLLGGALLWGHESNATLSAATTLRRGLPARLKAVVLARDNHVCRCCGFRSEQFQEVMVWGSTRDPERMATACIFCHQAYHLDWVPGMRSGHLIWLPEMDQIELNRLVREARIFMRRSSGTLAKKVIEHLADRRGAAHERLGTDSLEEAISVLRQIYAAADPRFDDLMSGLRLLPLAHRYVTEASFEYNQFPRILDYWRSPGGPCGGASDHPLMDDYVRRMIDQPSADSPSETEADGAVSIDESRSGAKHQTRAEQGIRDVDVEFGTDCEWTPMDGEIYAGLEQDSPIDGLLYLRRDGTSYFSTLLPWYANARLLRVTDEDWPVEGMAIYYLMTGTNEPGRHNLLRLDGSSGPIHQMNRRHGIQLDGDNAVGYLRFFCYFVHGDEGPFFVTDEVARRELMQASDGADLESLLPALEAPVAEGPDELGSYQCEAGVWYATSLFTASFRISANGEIEMENDEQVAAGLRIRPQARIRL